MTKFFKIFFVSCLSLDHCLTIQSNDKIFCPNYGWNVVNLDIKIVLKSPNGWKATPTSKLWMQPFPHDEKCEKCKQKYQPNFFEKIIFLKDTQQIWFGFKPTFQVLKIDFKLNFFKILNWREFELDPTRSLYQAYVEAFKPLIELEPWRFKEELKRSWQLWMNLMFLLLHFILSLEFHLNAIMCCN